MPLTGKTALVTGSGRNIGRAIALVLAKEGVNIVVNARSNQEEAESVAQEVRDLGAQALPVLADVGHKEAVDAMVAQALEVFGSVDILVSNVAIRPHKPFLEVSPEEWRRVMAVVLDAAFYCTQATVPSMVEHQWGRLIYITGAGSYRGASLRSHISAAKMGVAGMARSLAVELAPHNITANVVSPGTIDTSRDLSWYPEGAPSAHVAAEVPMGRPGTPQEIASTCRFLASQDAGYITGQNIHVNGGMYFAW